MAKLLKLRGGTTSQHGSFTGADREVTVDTDKETLVVHNGSTAGGFPLARADGTGTTNFTITGEMESGSLDVNGNADISGELTMGGNIDLQDNDKLMIGTGDDLQIYHDGSNSVIADAGTGNLKILANDFRLNNAADSEIMIKGTQDGEVTLHHNGSQKLATKSDGVDITGELQCDTLDVDGNADISGTLTMGSNINLSDNIKLMVGNNNDLQIYHDGSNSYIDDTSTGDLYIRANDQLRLQKYTGENMIVGNVDAGVQLFFNNSEKLVTLTSGVYVTGDIQASTGLFGLDGNDYLQFVNNSRMDIYINGNNEFRFESDGDFHADGDVIAFSTTVSDERLKTDIKKIENATDKVSQLNGYTFTYKADGKKGAGVIAQELEKVLPSAVKEKELPLKTDDEVAYKTVEYNQIIGLLVESIKELKQEINELKGV